MRCIMTHTLACRSAVCSLLQQLTKDDSAFVEIVPARCVSPDNDKVIVGRTLFDTPLKKVFEVFRSASIEWVPQVFDPWRDTWTLKFVPLGANFGKIAEGEKTYIPRRAHAKHHVEILDCERSKIVVGAEVDHDGPSP
jgi:hypothetical protein